MMRKPYRASLLGVVLLGLLFSAALCRPLAIQVGSPLLVVDGNRVVYVETSQHVFDRWTTRLVLSSMKRGQRRTIFRSSWFRPTSYDCLSVSPSGRYLLFLTNAGRLTVLDLFKGGERPTDEFGTGYRAGWCDDESDRFWIGDSQTVRVGTVNGEMVRSIRVEGRRFFGCTSDDALVAIPDAGGVEGLALLDSSGHTISLSTSKTTDISLVEASEWPIVYYASRDGSESAIWSLDIRSSETTLVTRLSLERDSEVRKAVPHLEAGLLLLSVALPTGVESDLLLISTADGTIRRLGRVSETYVSNWDYSPETRLLVRARGDDLTREFLRW